MQINTVAIQNSGGAEISYLVNGGISVPVDGGNIDYQAVLAWVAGGNIPEIYIEPTVDVTVISQRELIIALRELGLWQELRALLVANDDIWDEWLAVTTIDINYPLVATMRDAMGWTPKQLQDLFNEIGQA